MTSSGPDNINGLGYKAVLHLAFFLSGIATVLIGQVLPILTTKFGLTDLQAGYFFPAQFAGSLLGTIATDRFARRSRLGIAAVVGTISMAAGLLMMNLNAFDSSLAGFVLNGIGIGMTLPAINILVLEMHAERPAAALSILNFFWGVGAIVSKPFVDLTSGPDDIRAATVTLASLLSLFAVLLVFTGTRSRASHAPDAQNSGESLAIWTSPTAWLIALFNFIHVGFESGIGGWLTSYAGRFDDAPEATLLSATLFYFLFFVAGRATAPVILRYLSEDRFLFFSLAIVLAGTMVILGAGVYCVLLIGAAITGFGTSAVFPTNVSRFSKVFGADAMRRAMPLFICGTLGATAVTSLIGYVSDRTGDLRSGMGVLLACILSLIALQFHISVRTQRRHRDQISSVRR
jgi:FHS family glucose/mannose:H+ symporter-like MFS transporter